MLSKKRVSVRLIPVDSFALTFFIYIYIFFKCFPLVGMTTKFNIDMYVKMRSKKDEPLSNLGKRTVHVIGKGPPVTPTILGTEVTRTTSPATYVEEIPTPTSKRPRLECKGKEKADPRASNIWDNVELEMERAHEVVTTEDLKVFSGVPSNKVVAYHIHILVQVKYLCNFSSSPFFFFFKGSNFLFKCWGRVFTSQRSTLPRKPRLRL